MLVEKIVLEDVTELVATGNERARALAEVGDERVELVLVEGGQIDSTGHKDRIRLFGNRLQGSLDSIEDSLENTYTQEL